VAIQQPAPAVCARRRQHASEVNPVASVRGSLLENGMTRGRTDPDVSETAMGDSRRSARIGRCRLRSYACLFAAW
jgi:hypothetical protein